MWLLEFISTACELRRLNASLSLDVIHANLMTGSSGVFNERNDMVAFKREPYLQLIS